MTAAAIPIAIAPLQRGDWNDVARIYAEGIATGDATFETEVPDWERWDSSHMPGHRLTATAGGTLVGWAALAPVSERCVYAGVAEVSVYVSADARGHGIGAVLLEALIASSEACGRCRRASSPRTRPARGCMNGRDSASSAGARGWAVCTGPGAMCCSWNGAARWWDSQVRCRMAARSGARARSVTSRARVAITPSTTPPNATTAADAEHGDHENPDRQPGRPKCSLTSARHVVQILETAGAVGGAGDDRLGGTARWRRGRPRRPQRRSRRSGRPAQA